jgi:hypothetical protein
LDDIDDAELLGVPNGDFVLVTDCIDVLVVVIDGVFVAVPVVDLDTDGDVVLVKLTTDVLDADTDKVEVAEVFGVLELVIVLVSDFVARDD